MRKKPRHEADTEGNDHLGTIAPLLGRIRRSSNHSSGAPPLSLAASLRWPIVESWLDRIQPASVLEAGCGMGAMGYRLALRSEYRGYEPDLSSYETAALRLAGIESAEVFPTPVPDQPDRQFDLVAAFEVLEHIEDDVAELRRWSRWTAPSGFLMLSVPAHPERFGPCDRDVGHFRRYSRNHLELVVREGGFEPIAVKTWGMPFGYLLEAGRNALAKRRSTPTGTAGSGRLHQPPTALGDALTRVMRPLAAIEGLFRDSNLGIGFVLIARRSNSREHRILDQGETSHA